MERYGVVFDIGVGAGFGESPAGGGAHDAVLETFGCIGRADPLDVFGFALGSDAPRKSDLLGVRLVKLAAFEVGFMALKDKFDLLGGKEIGLFFGVVGRGGVVGHRAGEEDGQLFGLGDLDGELGRIASRWKIQTNGVGSVGQFDAQRCCSAEEIIDINISPRPNTDPDFLTGGVLVKALFTGFAEGGGGLSFPFIVPVALATGSYAAHPSIGGIAFVSDVALYTADLVAQKGLFGGGGFEFLKPCDVGGDCVVSNARFAVAEFDGVVVAFLNLAGDGAIALGFFAFGQRVGRRGRGKEEQTDRNRAKSGVGKEIAEEITEGAGLEARGASRNTGGVGSEARGTSRNTGGVGSEAQGTLRSTEGAGLETSAGEGAPKRSRRRMREKVAQEKRWHGNSEQG